MYILKHETGSQAFYIIENKTYILGRKGCDFLIQGDTSISKKHASFTIKNNLLEIEDIGSKYETFVNNIKIEQNTPIILKDSDVIKFGILKSIYRVEHKNFIVISSGLKTTNKKELENILKTLNGELVKNWDENLTYLATDKMLLTLKVVHAIVEGLPIVTLDYFKEFIDCIQKNHPPPDVKDFIPELKDFNHKNLSFEYNPERKTLFKNKTFVFKTKSTISEIILASGGKSILYNEEKITKDHLIGYEPQYLLIQEEEIKPNSNHPFDKLLKLSSELNKRPIPLQEIPIAVVMCSCEKNCNPDFQRIDNLIQNSSQYFTTENVLVPETEGNLSKLNECTMGSVKNVPETPYTDVIDLDEVDKVNKVVKNEESINLDDSTLKPDQKAGVKRLNVNDLQSKENVKRLKVDFEQQGTNLESNIRSTTNKPTFKKPTENVITSTQKHSNDNKLNVSVLSVSQISKRTFSESMELNENENETSREAKKAKVLNPFGVFAKPSTSKDKSSVKNPFRVVKNEPVVLQEPNLIQASEGSKQSDREQNRQEITDHRQEIKDNRQEIKDNRQEINDHRQEVKVENQKEEQQAIWRTTNNNNTNENKENLIKEENITLDDEQEEFLWRTVSDSFDEMEVKRSNKALNALMTSFKDCVVIKKVPLAIERNYAELTTNYHQNGNTTNFKKFKKVMPLHMQTTIVCNFTKIVCGDTSVNSLNGLEV